jgi:Ca2+-binding RTX toxin-like protein
VRHIQRIVGVGVVLAACALGSTPALASGSPSCSYDWNTRQVTVIHDSAGPLTVGAQSFQAAIYVTDGTNTAWCAGLFETDKIVIKAASPAAYQHTIIDERTAVFGPGATKESSGVSEIEISVLTGTGGDQLTVLQFSAGRHDVRLRTSPTSLSLGPEIDLNGDGDYDVGMTQAGLVKVVGTGGSDRIDASGVSTFPVQLHGGVGADVLIGGTRNDTLYANGTNTYFGDHESDLLFGGAGADTLSAKDDSADSVYGGADYDGAQVDPADTTVSVERLF